MKNLLLIILSIIFTYPVFAQDTTGLIAHWKMNGNALDATGHGHNGNLHNVTNTGGKAGTANTGYYFTGSTSTPSFISIPYSPAFNVSKYSLCAIVKVTGFYSGLCQASTIFTRGRYTNVSSSGTYQLFFTDNQSDGNNCTDFDSTKMCFQSHSSNNNHANYPDAAYTPAIVENTWYSVVITFDDTTYKVYVDGTLKSTALVATPGTPIGNSTDSLVIGFNTFDAVAGYPNPFKGAIDDIRLYNRVLTTSEITDYTTSTLDVPNTTNKELEIAVYPNPAKDKINLQFETNDAHGSVQLLNELGQLITTKEIESGHVTINTSTMPAGMYLLRLQIGEEVLFKKFVKE